MTGLRGLARRLLPFLRTSVPLDEENVRRVLLVQTGSPQNAQRVLASLHQRFPEAQVALLLAPTDARAMRASTGSTEVRLWQGVAGLRALRAWAAAQRFDAKVVLFTGEGRTLLKLVAFALPAPVMLVYSEGGGSFRWSFDERLAIWNHVRWRLGGGRPFLAALAHLGEVLVVGFLSLVAFLWLLVWHGVALVMRSVRRRTS